MAGVQWADGKMHGSIEAKNSMMHDTKDTRLIHGHSNPDIDLAKTPNNMSYRGLTYSPYERRRAWRHACPIRLHPA